MRRLGFAWLCLIFLIGVAMFQFTCDDAWIAFRYGHNLTVGRGLVWNPAPFPPVEGYSSLLWVLLTAGGALLTGLGPDTIAASLLALSGLGSLALIAHWLHRTQTDPMVSWVALFGIVSNRTFLIWSASGLEQGFFTFVLLSWLYAARWSHTAALCGLAGILPLVRPDGLLPWALTLLFCVRKRVRRPALAMLALPLLHLLWRRWTYGLWLPNTYYAKHAAWWPESGLVYLISFVTEYALFLWIPLLWLGRHRFRSLGEGWILGALAVGGHLAYYTLAIGGDHFGFRVFHHLVPLLWLALPWLLAPVTRALPVAVALLVSSWIIPWTHHARTHDLEAVRARGGDPHAVSDVLGPLAPWGWLWEEQQAWLRGHFVCVRVRAHQSFIRRQQRTYGKERRTGDLGPLPVLTVGTVGWPGWVLPDVFVIDRMGLNDPVAARTPIRHASRQMAHDRDAPPAYLECFDANITASEGTVEVRWRGRPLTEQDIVDCVQRHLPTGG